MSVNELCSALCTNGTKAPQESTHPVDESRGLDLDVPPDLPLPEWATCHRWDGDDARRLWWRIARTIARRLETGELRGPLEAIEAQAAACVDARDLLGLRALAAAEENET